MQSMHCPMFATDYPSQSLLLPRYHCSEARRADHGTSDERIFIGELTRITFTTRNQAQNDLRDIWGLAEVCPAAVEAPPTARRMDCSKSSRVPASSCPAASLKADGDDVANDSSCDTVCVITGDVC